MSSDSVPPEDVPPVDDADPADLVAAAVLAVPGVHGLRAGIAGEAATYLPGRRVAGVVLRDGRCAVHVVLEWGATVELTAGRVRTAVSGVTSGPVDVVVEDVTDPGTPRLGDVPVLAAPTP